MKRFANAKQVKREIDSYEKHFTGAPMVIGVDDAGEYTVLLGLLKDDPGKQIIHMSDSCSLEFPQTPLSTYPQ